MFENPRRGRQARNFTTNAPKILDLKSSSEQLFSRKLPLGAPVKTFSKFESHVENVLFYLFFDWSLVTTLRFTNEKPFSVVNSVFDTVLKYLHAHASF